MIIIYLFANKYFGKFIIKICNNKIALRLVHKNLLTLSNYIFDIIFYFLIPFILNKFLLFIYFH